MNEEKMIRKIAGKLYGKALERISDSGKPIVYIGELRQILGWYHVTRREFFSWVKKLQSIGLIEYKRKHVLVKFKNLPSVVRWVKDGAD